MVTGSFRTSPTLPAIPTIHVGLIQSLSLSTHRTSDLDCESFSIFDIHRQLYLELNIYIYLQCSRMTLLNQRLLFLSLDMTWLLFTILGASNSQSMPDRGNRICSQRGMTGLEYDSRTVRKSGQVLWVFELCKFEIIHDKLLVTPYHRHKIGSKKNPSLHSV